MNRERRAVRRSGGAGLGVAGLGVAGLGVWRARRLIWRERRQACRAQPLVCRERPLVCRTRPLAWQVRRLALLRRPLAWQVRRLTHEAFCDVAFGAVAYVACGELTRFRSFRSPHRRSHRTGSRATPVRVPHRSAHRVVLPFRRFSPPLAGGWRGRRAGGGRSCLGRRLVRKERSERAPSPIGSGRGNGCLSR